MSFLIDLSPPVILLLAAALVATLGLVLARLIQSQVRPGSLLLAAQVAMAGAGVLALAGLIWAIAGQGR